MSQRLVTRHDRATTRLWAVMQADHDLVWDLLNTLTGGKGSPRPVPKEQKRISRDLVALESVHEVAEELVIWPAVREYCSSGKEMVDEALAQEAEAKAALNELRQISPGTTEFRQCVSTIAGSARTHISFEQNQIWPRLAGQLDGSELDELADRWEAARASAPTRPHPHTPAWPLLLASAGRVIAWTDRTRDLFLARRVPEAGGREGAAQS